jgi:nucleoside-diphosphate-sugar epimerase
MGHDLKPVLVTGAGGYLGGRVIAALRDGAQGISRTDCDLCDAEAVARLVPDWSERSVIHLAAQVPRSAADYNDDEAGEANLRMVEALLAQRPRHLVFASSMAVYCAADLMPVREDSAGPPARGYAGSKRRAEMLALDTPETRVTVLRLPGLFGAPRLAGLLWNVALALACGDAPRLPARPVLWAALHVEDAARAFVAAAQSMPDRSRIVNAGYPGTFSTTLAVNALATLFGRGALTEAEAPEFAMDLTRMQKNLGLPERRFEGRLRDLAEAAKRHA